MKFLRHGASYGGLSCASSPVKPHDDGCNLDDEIDPITHLFEDSDPGVLVTSRYIELVTVVVEGTRGCCFCQDLKSSSYNLA